MKLIPKSFLWRTILMMLIPLVIAQVIVAYAFFGNHWERVHATMARSLTGEIVTMLNLMDSGNDAAVKMMASGTGINVSVNAHLNRPRHNDNGAIEVGHLARDLHDAVKTPANIYIDRGKRLVFVDIKRGDNITTFATSLYNIYSTSTEAFLIWLAGSIIVVMLLMLPFIIGHTKSIRRLAYAATRFGKNQEVPWFTPTGSREVRSAATALITMKDRLTRYNRTRTDMLNAVSHDLKTPLARVRLGLETGADEKTLLSDIDRMAAMLNGYLNFARGEIPEIEQEITLPPMLTRIARDNANGKKIITHFPKSPVAFYARPAALASAFQNIIENAARYAKTKIIITEIDTDENVEITIDDDGIGIPADRRADAMHPFVRLDESRADATGGTGLGLSIAQTAVENHGGTIALDDAPHGGLRVRITLPV